MSGTRLIWIEQNKERAFYIDRPRGILAISIQEKGIWQAKVFAGDPRAMPFTDPSGRGSAHWSEWSTSKDTFSLETLPDADADIVMGAAELIIAQAMESKENLGDLPEDDDITAESAPDQEWWTHNLANGDEGYSHVNRVEGIVGLVTPVGGEKTCQGTVYWGDQRTMPDGSPYGSVDQIRKWNDWLHAETTYEPHKMWGPAKAALHWAKDRVANMLRTLKKSDKETTMSHPRLLDEDDVPAYRLQFVLKTGNQIHFQAGREGAYTTFDYILNASAGELLRMVKLEKTMDLVPSMASTKTDYCLVRALADLDNLTAVRDAVDDFLVERDLLILVEEGQRDPEHTIYEVTLRVRVDRNLQGSPADWDWAELLEEEPENLVLVDVKQADGAESDFPASVDDDTTSEEVPLGTWPNIKIDRFSGPRTSHNEWEKVAKLIEDLPEVKEWDFDYTKRCGDCVEIPVDEETTLRLGPGRYWEVYFAHKDPKKAGLVTSEDIIDEKCELPEHYMRSGWRERMAEDVQMILGIEADEEADDDNEDKEDEEVESPGLQIIRAVAAARGWDWYIDEDSTEDGEEGPIHTTIGFISLNESTPPVIGVGIESDENDAVNHLYRYFVYADDVKSTEANPKIVLDFDTRLQIPDWRATAIDDLLKHLDTRLDPGEGFSAGTRVMREVAETNGWTFDAEPNEGDVDVAFIGGIRVSVKSRQWIVYKDASEDCAGLEILLDSSSADVEYGEDWETEMVTDLQNVLGRLDPVEEIEGIADGEPLLKWQPVLDELDIKPGKHVETVIGPKDGDVSVVVTHGGHKLTIGPDKAWHIVWRNGEEAVQRFGPGSDGDWAERMANDIIWHYKQFTRDQMRRKSIGVASNRHVQCKLSDNGSLHFQIDDPTWKMYRKFDFQLSIPHRKLVRELMDECKETSSLADKSTTKGYVIVPSPTFFQSVPSLYEAMVKERVFDIEVAAK